MTGEPQSNKSSQLATLEEWIETPSAELALETVALLDALVYGRVIVQSTEGSELTMVGYHVGSDGLCKTKAIVDILGERTSVVLRDDEGQIRIVPPHEAGKRVLYPQGPVQANFFRGEGPTVGKPFSILIYDHRVNRRNMVLLTKVERITIEPLDRDEIKEESAIFDLLDYSKRSKDSWAAGGVVVATPLASAAS